MAVDLEARVRTLRDEVDLLREQNRQLRASVMDTLPFPTDWNLTWVQAKMFAILVNKTTVSTDAFMTLLYGDRDEPPQLKIFHVQICLMRKLLQPFGIAIHTRIGQGYFLAEDVRARFRVRSAP